MRALRIAALVGVLLLPAILAGAQPVAPPASVPPASVPVASVTVPPLALTPVQLDALPAREAAISTGEPAVSHRFTGPLLWDVLVASGAVDPAAHRFVPRQIVVLRGADGYAAILALAEISPDFAARPAILATAQDGTPLDAPRAVLPGEGRPARSVRDLAGVAVQLLGPAPP